MNGFGRCPRCGQMRMEHLKTHSHCWECNYFPESETRLRVRKKLEEEAYSGKNFEENEASYWAELLGEEGKSTEISDEEIDDYHDQVAAENKEGL